MVLIILIVDQNYALRSDIHADVADVTSDFIQIVFDPIKSQLRKLVLTLRVSHEGPGSKTGIWVGGRLAERLPTLRAKRTRFRDCPHAIEQYREISEIATLAAWP